MVIIWGQRMYGRVDRFAGSHVATRFFHLYYVPLIPLSSWLVLEEQTEGNFIGLQLPLQWRSVLLAWLRVAAVLAAISGGVHYLSADHLQQYEGGSGMHPAQISAILAMAAAFAVGFYAYFRLGKLRREEKAARVVYWDFAGRFVDVALLTDDRRMVKQRATEELDRHLARHATSSYREAPNASWRHIATRPELRDVPLLKAALTRCRVEWADAEGEERRAFEREHSIILRNLLAASPELLEVERYEMKR